MAEVMKEQGGSDRRNSEEAIREKCGGSDARTRSTEIYNEYGGRGWKKRKS
jgi:hypothetical protein